MGKKKRKFPDVEEVLARPWCYYCERDFDDLKILISHQKAKHFKCERCGRRLNTAGGLSVHMNQVHKEQLNAVENALPNRKGLEVEIFGMEGIPEDILQTHKQRVLQQFYEQQQERIKATGNPAPGGKHANTRKKPKIETPEELRKRLAEWRAQKALEKSGMANGNTSLAVQSPDVPMSNSPVNFPQSGPPPASQQPPTAFPPGQAAFPGAPGAFPPGASGQSFSPSTVFPPPGMPGPPPGLGGPGLPQRPTFNAPALNQFQMQQMHQGQGVPGGANGDTAAAVDELIASAARGAAASQVQVTEDTAAKENEKKGKKDKEKNQRLVWSDNKVSPEERMARSERYRFVVS